MKRKLVALGLAAVMTVGGSVMAFASDYAKDEKSTADITFEVDLDPVIEPPNPPDKPDVTDPELPTDPTDPDPEVPGPDPDPDKPNLPHPGLVGTEVMNLSFGVRSINDLAKKDNDFTTRPFGADLSYGAALVEAPPVGLRVMGVAFENDIAFSISVKRSDFETKNNTKALGGGKFTLVRYGKPTATVGDDSNIDVYERIVINDSTTPVANAKQLGRYVAAFSGELSGVAQSQVPSDDKFSATLTWVMGAPLTN